jgi:hypothetical protein
MAGTQGAIRLTRIRARALSIVGAMVLALAGAMAGTRAVSAHHSVLPFDGATPTTVEGTVVRILWQNPHTMLAIDDGRERWTIEVDGGAILERIGWTRDVVKAGDKVRVIGARAKDGRRLLRCRSVTTQDRRTLTCFG